VKQDTLKVAQRKSPAIPKLSLNGNTSSNQIMGNPELAVFNEQQMADEIQSPFTSNTLSPNTNPTSLVRKKSSVKNESRRGSLRGSRRGSIQGSPRASAIASPRVSFREEVQVSPRGSALGARKGSFRLGEKLENPPIKSQIV